MRRAVFTTSLLGVFAAVFAAAPADAAVIPVSSRVTTYVDIWDLPPVSNTHSQGATLNGLSTEVNHAGLGMTFHNTAAATFSGATAGQVDLFATRSDTGQRAGFGFETGFEYTFTVDEPTLVSVDYDVLGQSTSGSAVNVEIYWGMTGEVLIDGAAEKRFNFWLDLGVGDYTPPPYRYEGTAERLVQPGTRTLWIALDGGATGDLAAVRTLTGTFNFRIGDTIPEPTSAATLVGACFLCLRRAPRSRS